jgi:response regulator RpfG family c-di-GMP phosphodiesterase
MAQQVLIVDDTKINLLLFDALVKKIEDCESHSFADPLKGLEWVQNNVPDLVIVDYMMPELNGLDFIQRLRTIPGRSSVPILMITANSEIQIRYDALEMGANDFLTKPVDKVEFMARTRNMLGLNDARKKLANQADWLAGEVRKATQAILERERETVLRLCRAAEFRDPETGAHILRMAHYSRLIARELGLSEADQDLLLEAAPMHDIGKVGIPDKILLKPGRLDADEFEVMKQHASLGHELLKGSSSKVLQAGADIALGHHEKFDGSGYPNGTKGEDIPLFSRIVAVADVFDALTSERPYKKAWSMESSIDFLHQGAGSHFDPSCVKAFMAAWDDVVQVRERFRDED